MWFRRMIDFTCKNFNLEEVIKCSMGLSKSEFKLLKFFLKKNKNFNTEELCAKLRLDKSTIQRGVKKLYEKKLLIRKQVNQSGGGYLFLYTIEDKTKIRNIILKAVDGWIKIFHKRITKW